MVVRAYAFGDKEASTLSCVVGLRELKMDKCFGMTDVGLATIPVGCNKLHRLSLKWCMEITNLGINLPMKNLRENFGIGGDCESLRFVTKLQGERVSGGWVVREKCIFSKRMSRVKKPCVKVPHKKKKNTRKKCHISTANVSFVHLAFSLMGEA